MFKSLFKKLFNKQTEEVDSLSHVTVSYTKSGLRIKVNTDCTHVNVYSDSSGMILTPNNHHGFKVHKGWIHLRKSWHPELPLTKRKVIKTYNHTDGKCFFWSQVNEVKQHVQ